MTKQRGQRGPVGTERPEGKPVGPHSPAIKHPSFMCAAFICVRLLVRPCMYVCSHMLMLVRLSVSVCLQGPVVGPL